MSNTKIDIAIAILRGLAVAIEREPKVEFTQSRARLMLKTLDGLEAQVSDLQHAQDLWLSRSEHMEMGQ